MFDFICVYTWECVYVCVYSAYRCLKVSVLKSRKYQWPLRPWNARGVTKRETDLGDRYTNTHEGLALYWLLLCASFFSVCVNSYFALGRKRLRNLLGRGRGMFKDLQRKCVVPAALSSTGCFWNSDLVWIYQHYLTEWDKFITAIIEYSKAN